MSFLGRWIDGGSLDPPWSNDCGVLIVPSSGPPVLNLDGTQVPVTEGLVLLQLFGWAELLQL
jgi:hypothetical protein